MEKMNNLTKFLQKAKKRTFASKIARPTTNLNGSKEYKYQEGDLIYRDCYFGSTVDTGQELVFKKNKLIWSMSYRGGMIQGSEKMARTCFSFLKKCLRNFPPNFPVRGPSRKEEGDFKYKNNWDGDLEDFVGEEKIFWKGKQIYFRNYIGGVGKPRKLRLQ